MATHFSSNRPDFAPLDTQQIRLENFFRLSRRGMVMASVMHAVFGIVAWFIAPILFYLQLISIAVYPLCYFLSLRGHSKTVQALVLTDLLGHSTLATLIVGFDAGFQYYSWILLPLTFTNLELSQKERFWRALALCSVFLVIDWVFRQTTPLVQVSAAGIEAMRYFNIICFFTATTSSAAQFTKATTTAQEQLRHAADTDMLTGLLNRRRMSDKMLHIWQHARNSRHAIAVMLLDIDYFKSINDRYGHAVGDEVIAGVGTVLQQSVRRGDLVARWGGEEFLILLPQAPLTVAYEIAERIRAQINQITFPANATIRVSATAGVAAWRPSESLDATIHRADTLLYLGKRGGRNQVVVEGHEELAPKQQLAS
jgi:diguanylate cyclase (GGDEF)-like protein